MSALLLALVLNTIAADEQALPPVSPSVEHDAEYLLTTDDFSCSQFGMAVEDVREDGGRLTVRTTGAEFVFEPAAGTLRLRQRLGKAREAAVVSLGEGALTELKVEHRSEGAVLLSARGGDLRIRINGDSLLMLRDAAEREVSYRLGFSPLTVRQAGGNYLFLDEYGGVGSYLATGFAATSEPYTGAAVSCRLQPDQILWLSVAPPREYPWEDSLRDRVCWHWSTQTGYPPDSDIETWSRHGNILLQQSEVMLWKDWSLRFIPRNGVEEFERVNRTCERLGMRNIVYTSPFYFLTGTGLESRAMNSFDNFAVTGFSPGDGRGLNWPIFIAEITKVVREYRPDGLYFDGIYDNVVRTYIVARKAREIVGERGLLEYHATGSPPGGGVYLPQIDTYFNFILRGEGCEAQYTDPDYLRYFVSTYNTSNSIGVLCNNNDYPLDKGFVDTLLDDNVRLHYLLGGPEDQRTQGMTRYYWPALNEGLRARVERAASERETAGTGIGEALRRAASSDASTLRPIYEASFADAGFSANVNPEKPEDIALPDGWHAYLSPHSQGAISSEGGVLRISALGNTVAYLERPVPDDTVAVGCRIRGTAECGMSWGPGLLLRIGARMFRAGLRSDDRAQIDRGGSQTLFEGFPLGSWSWLRLRFVEGCALYETSEDGTSWRCLQIEYVGTLDGPKSVAVGKIPYDGSRTEYTDFGGPGGCEVTAVRVLGPAGTE